MSSVGFFVEANKLWIVRHNMPKHVADQSWRAIPLSFKFVEGKDTSLSNTNSFFADLGSPIH